MKIEWERTENGECTDLRLLPEKAKIIAIDDIPCVGMCESCNHPIVETDDYESDQDGILLCKDCILSFLNS